MAGPNYVDPASWPEDPGYTRADWKYEVANDDTLLGYADWVAHQKACDAELNDDLEADLGPDEFDLEELDPDDADEYTDPEDEYGD